MAGRKLTANWFNLKRTKRQKIFKKRSQKDLGKRQVNVEKGKYLFVSLSNPVCSKKYIYRVGGDIYVCRAQMAKSNY